MTKRTQICLLLCFLCYSTISIQGMWNDLNEISNDEDFKKITTAISSAVETLSLKEESIEQSNTSQETVTERKSKSIDAQPIEKFCFLNALHRSYLMYHLKDFEIEKSEERALAKKYNNPKSSILSLATLLSCQTQIGEKKKDPWYPAPDFLEEMEKDAMIIKTVLSGKYKIHLMPIVADFNRCVQLLINTLATNENMRKKVFGFKYIFSMKKLREQVIENHAEQILPRIVIYPVLGKTNAQELLYDVMHVYKDAHIHGLGIAPRFNYPQGYLDLVYWAQGDGDYKNDRTRNFYDQSHNQCCYDVKQIVPMPPHKDHYLSLNFNTFDQ